MISCILTQYNGLIRTIGRTLTSTINPSQIEPRSNDNEVILYAELSKKKKKQKKLTIRCSLVSYTGHPFFGGRKSYPSAGDTAYCKPH